jgi:hypothetical protein
MAPVVRPEQRPISPVDLFTGVLDVDNPSVDPGGIPDRADYLGFTFNPFVLFRKGEP